MKFFCKETVLTPMIALASYDAGYLFAKNDKEKAMDVLKVADAILVLAGKADADKGSLNGMFKEAVITLVNKEVKDELVKMNILGVLEMVEFTVENPVELDIPQIKGLVENFKRGIEGYRK